MRTPRRLQTAARRLEMRLGVPEMSDADRAAVLRAELAEIEAGMWQPNRLSDLVSIVASIGFADKPTRIIANRKREIEAALAKLQ